MSRRYAAAMRSTTPQRIVVLLDGTEDSERGLVWVRQLARGSDSAVHLLLIQPPGAIGRAGNRMLGSADRLEDAARTRAPAYLESAAARLREDGLTVVTDVRSGRSPHAIHAAIAEMGADIVVAGAADSDALRGVLRAAPVPVLVTGHECPRPARAGPQLRTRDSSRVVVDVR